MNNIFREIKRFNDMNFIDGEHFSFTLECNKTEKKIIVTDKMVVGGEYEITVKKYMTELATPSFDFMSKWNNNIPMPLVTMTGSVLKETRGMVYMNLHGVAKATSRCMKCGKTLTNPISKLYGMGPECGSHFYINPFDSEEELQNSIEEVQSKMENIKWEGWVIKSAIKEWEVI